MTLNDKERKKRYKKSLNLPRTSFPMRANLAQNESQSRKRWARESLFEQVMEARADGPVFAFHDGPPFANGSIHVGHLLNKVLKDVVVRSRLLTGHQCHYVPGWDCHGLPIEHMVMTGLVESGKIDKLNSLEVDQRRMAIRRECQRSAEKFKKLQAEQMQQLLTLADYDQPYLTMAPEYEQSVLDVFAGLVEQGLVYRDLKPVHWSIANRTALAEAELEYQDRVDPSIYVCFEAVSRDAVAKAFGVELTQSPSFMIWTTTPWTLPANLLIAVHNDFEYSLVRFGDRLTVVASELLAKVAEVGGDHVGNSEAGSDVEVLAKVKGKALLDLEYLHPFCDRRGHIVAADYVTLEDGTGLVHTAPGHGQEDFATGQKLGLEPYSPVRADGTYDDTVPEWLRGLTVWQANPLVIERLRASGHMYHDLEFSHSYPHDWRSKTPVIFRCTEQWFIAVDRPSRRDDKSLRELAMHASENSIRFVPDWGRNRMRGMLESRPDWCISRQRSWGLPIPAFRTPDGDMLLTPATVRAVGEAFEKEGSDAWFQRSPAELLATWDAAADPDAPAAVDLESLEKTYDIFDVWLESGSSWNAVMRRRGLGYPTDLYLEGSDQHRGWFQLSLLPALGVTGVSPFKTVLTHGFMVDKDGKKMSKSLKNTLEVADLLKEHGADVLRWWVSSLAFETDIKVDPSFFTLAGESYRKVRNTLRFLLSNLDDFDAAKYDGALKATSIDALALSQAAELSNKVVEAFENYRFRQAHQLLFDFCNDDLSAFYLDAVKDRLYCDRTDAERRRQTQHTMHQIAELLICLLSPILPHTADEAYRALLGDDAGSVHLRTVPKLNVASLDAGWQQVIEVREQVLRALESAKAQGIDNPLDAGLQLPDDGTLARFAEDLPDIMGVSRVALIAADQELAIEDLREQPRCERSWRRDATVRQREDGGWLSDRDAEAVAASIDAA